MKNNNFKKINIGGLFFDNVDLNETINLMEKRIQEYEGEKTLLLCAANQDIINKSTLNYELNSQLINEGSYSGWIFNYICFKNSWYTFKGKSCRSGLDGKIY